MNACTKILKPSFTHEGEVVTGDLGTSAHATGLPWFGELWWPPCAPSTTGSHSAKPLAMAPNLSVQLHKAEHPAISEGLTLGEIISLVFCMEEEGTQVLVMT